MDPERERFLLSGEFHYFRVPRDAWPDRLSTMATAGLDTVSIYTPWNWHQPDRDTSDFGGAEVPERDLIGALDDIDRAGLRCILRPGPFITAEWRNGGIPDWLLQDSPDIRSRSASGTPVTRGDYPVITYAHRSYREAAAGWLRAVVGATSNYLASRGGPIVGVQVDDETSYWQSLMEPLALDFHPILVGPTPGGSLFGRWLVKRYGSLEAAASAHRCRWTTLEDVVPPVEPMAEAKQVDRFVDWLDFKLSLINDYVEFCVGVLLDAGVDVPLSMLFPYLSSMQASKFSEFAERRGLLLNLTNECYLSLFGPTQFPEQKVAAVISCHESYRMWRRPWSGPAVTMEMQSSNSTFIPPSVMEVLYRLSIARGIRGMNYFMMVGGTNPAGFENNTGSEYDIDAPIAADGHVRPHYETIQRLSRVVRAGEDVLMSSEPARDLWIGCSAPYDAQSMGGGALVLDAWGIQTLLPQGDMGMSEADGLQALMALSSVSWGCLDLDRWAGPDGGDAGPPLPSQLWVGCLRHLSRQVQERLARYVRDGGHLVMLPMVPTRDEALAPCAVLTDLIFADSEVPDFVGFTDGLEGRSLIRTRDGGTIVVPGGVTRLTLPPDATPLAFADVDNGDGSGSGPCAFTRSVGAGTVSLLGFRLGYDPTGGPAGSRLLLDLVESNGRRRVAWATNDQCQSFLLSGPSGGFVCVVNPVDVPVSTMVEYTPPGGDGRRSFPLSCGGLGFADRGAVLLPIGHSLGAGIELVHSTWEVLGSTPATRIDDALLTLSTRRWAGGELLLGGDVGEIRVEGGAMESSSPGERPGERLVQLSAERDEVRVRVGVDPGSGAALP